MNSIEDFLLLVNQEKINKHLQKTKSCVPIGMLIAFNDDAVILDSAQQKHIKECDFCRGFLYKLSWGHVKSIKREDFPRAAGGIEVNIVNTMLNDCDIPDNAKIICEKKSQGYSFRVKANVPLKLKMEFYQNDIILYDIEVSRSASSDQIVPFEYITKFTEIRVYRKK